MVLTDRQPAPRDASPGAQSAARLLAEGRLGSRLIMLARLAAAVHMAESARMRTGGAQHLPAPPGDGGPR